MHLYLATATEDAVQIHQYAEAELSVALAEGTLGLQMRTNYPSDDVVTLTITEAPAAEAGLSLRIPAWAKNATVEIDGTPLTPGEEIRQIFTPGQRITLTLPREVRVVQPDPRIDAVRGTVAIERGPWVLALEDIDIDAETTVNEVAIDLSEPPVAVGADDAEVTLKLLTEPSSWWPYTEGAEQPASSATRVRLHPYRVWAERGPTTMRIFLPLPEQESVPATSE
ncbi:beta-L-arabinofuranosidase domain-containing protein [Nesterenkonia alba]|uniref:beta-L-arabinofuranosidase domain-containing protein n=1 Tax=Nesterenkonia alba TaxID=515814 RepID=UPI0003B369E3